MPEALNRYDQPRLPLFQDAPASAAHARMESRMRTPDARTLQLQKSEMLPRLRKFFDDAGLRVPVSSRIKVRDQGRVRGEWVIADGASPHHRLLYLHGGAFSMGSPSSHRQITSELSARTGFSVFALDYRLMPEFSRQVPISDARKAYQWILDNGPDGLAPIRNLVLAGDSAGGNLTLMLLAWARDHKVRQADCAVALSPSVDSTLSSPSIRRNIGSDSMLRPMMEPLLEESDLARAAGMGRRMRIEAHDARVSPVYGDLSGLPATLIQASAAECLEDDARRYTNKARAAGSPVELQLWANTMHAWQCFEPEVPEAKQAFAQIARFVAAACNQPVEHAA